MSDEREKRAYELFEAALQHEVGQRDGFLEKACAGDAELRAEVESLLAADAGAGSFLSPPPPGDEEPLLEQVRQAVVPGSSEAGGAATETQTAAPHPASLPKRLGQYHIKRVIATAGMGTVYEATQEKPRRTVAVKVMKHGIASRSALRRFEYESQVLARFRHPGIAQVYEAGTHRDESGTVPFFAMEYIPNAKSITRYADDKKLGTRERMSLFAEVCDAVHHGHQKGVIHRDLKPSTILVDPSGQVKIIDFGVARSTDSDMAVTTLQTDVGQLIGTLQYMSPEQCEADPHDLDTRSDVYALGVVFYELLCGRLPYDVTKMAIHQATQAIREQLPTKLSTINRTLRGDVETIALKALEKDRDRRYQAAADLAQDIHRYLNNEAISARPASMIYHVRVFARRNKPLVGAVIAVFVVLIAATVVSSSQYFKAENARELAVEARDEADKQRETAVAAREEAEENLATARAGRDYLLDVLDYVGETARQNREVTARGILDYFAEWVGASQSPLASEPLFEVSVRLALGRDHVFLGNFESAEEQLDKAVALRQQELGEAHWDTLRAMQNKGMALLQQGKEAEAGPILRKALEGQWKLERDPTFEPPFNYTRWSERLLAQALEEQEKYSELERHARATLEARRRRFDGNFQWIGLPTSWLCKALDEQGKYAEAETLARETLQSTQRAHGREHGYTVMATEFLYDNLRAQRRLDEARPYTIELISHHKRAAEEPDARADAINEYAMFLMTCEPEDLRDPAAALPVAQRAVEMTESEDAGVLDTLAMAYFMTGDTAKAIETQEKAVSLVPPDESEMRTELEANLAKYRAGSTTEEPAAN